MNTDFIKGVIVPILTPIDEEERIDEAKLREQVDYVIEGGVLGIAAACVWFAQAALENAQRPQPRYLLKDTGGYVSLYTADGRGPLAQYDLLTRLLPEQDVLALQQGVPVQDEAELQQRLEDYGL